MACWRHDYQAREYVCTCDPPKPGDTGVRPEDVVWHPCPTVDPWRLGGLA